MQNTRFQHKFFLVHPLLPAIIFVPGLFYVASHFDGFGLFTVVTVLAGLFFWTFSEYFLHRFILHLPFKARWSQHFRYIFHGMHHESPKDQYRVAAHPLLSFGIGSVMVLLFAFVLSSRFFWPFVFGFILGYLLYDYTHWLLHQNHWRNRVINGLRRNHAIHHFKDHKTCFGVTSPLWDIIFRTYHKFPIKK